MNTLRKQATWGCGLLLIFIGVIGFVSDGLYDGTGMLIGFESSTVHNLFYIATGVVGIFTVMESEAFTEIYLLAFGVMFSVLAIDGFVWDGHLLNLFPLYAIDNKFHMLLGTLGLVMSLWDMGGKPHGKRLWK